MLLRTRREFVKLSLRSITSAGAAAGMARLSMVDALAQSGGDYRALVVIFLFGGNDGNNTLVPLGSGYSPYAAVRGGLAIPSGALLPAATSAGAFGMHPALAPLHALYNQNRVAIVANVGMLVRPITRSEYLNGGPRPANLFSHSDQQSQWQSASPQGVSSTGWGGRISDIVTSLNTSSTFPTGVSVAGGGLLLVGNTTKPASIPPGTNGQLAGAGDDPASQARHAALTQILNFDTGFSLVTTANGALREGMRVGEIIAGLTQTPIATAFPSTGLGNQMAQIARLIQARNELGMRRQIFFCSMGGYDTHSNQAGQHQNLLTELSQAMVAFYNATVELGVAGNVTTCTESEFSRTFQPNGNAGTDHAWGGPQFVMGGAVNGGQMYGRFPELALQGPDDSGNRGNWIPTVSLDQYGATMAQWLGVSPGSLTAVFPNIVNFPAPTLGFL
jgi:uncharacterized protein (DUF1501 family)